MSEIGDNIIGYYKQALEARNNNKKELIEDISNSIEVLDTIQIVEETQTVIDSIDDPLEKFLFKFTNILKDNKQEDRKQLIEEFSEKIEETLQNEIKEETKGDDPLEKFLLKINNIIVTDKNEIVKNTALELIEQLKNKDEIVEEEEVEIKDLPIPPQPELGEVPNVTPPLEVKEQPKEKEITSSKNVYVDELQNADKDLTKAAEEDSLGKTIREEVGKQVKEILSKYRNGVVAEGGGGDGNFAKEFRNGGTMDGSLNVTGQYLSGGTDLFNIFSNSGGGSQTLSYNNSGNLSISSGNTVTLSSFKVVNASNQILSANTDLFDIFLTSETDSQTLSFNNTTSEISISNGNTVPLSGYVVSTINGLVTNNISPLSGNWNSVYHNVNSLSSNWNNASATAINYTHENFLPLSGGNINGELNVYANTYINNNLTVGGSLTALGTATFANTLFTTTSALSVVNTGPGPALYIYQSSGPYDVASFYDGDGIEVLHVGNANPNGLGRVGVNESFPNKELTVRGSISATETIYDSVGNSTQWNQAYSIGTAYQVVSSTFLPNVRQFDYVQINENSYSYCGSAPYGSLTSDSTWTIKRLLFTSVGTFLSGGTVYNSVWNNRYSYSY